MIESMSDLGQAERDWLLWKTALEFLNRPLAAYQ
jgi:hypothetical protein